MNIPASDLVAVFPGVISAGGSQLQMNGLVLTNSTRVPIGVELGFPTELAVSAYFGGGSKEASIAGIYFDGFDDSNVKPGNLLFTQYPQSAVAAYLRGGNVSALTLGQLQAISGTLTVIMDGYTHTAGSLNLAAATSFSSAASIIQTALDASEPTEASFTASIGASFTGTGTGTSLVATAVTGIISPGDTISGTGVPANTTIVSGPAGGGAGTYITNNATTASTAAITAISTVLDVTAVASGVVQPGQTLSGASVGAGVLITAGITGTGAAGTYRISGSQVNIASEAMTGIATAPTVAYDSVSGAFVVTSGITGAPSSVAYATGTTAAPLALTQATGAVLSQGSAAAVPGTFMDAVINQTQNWVGFMTSFNPDQSNQNSVRLAFAAWTSLQNQRYAYVCWDTDITPTESTNAASSLGQLIKGSSYAGTCLIWEPSDLLHAPFVLGYPPSLDFTEHNGRSTLAYKHQAGLTPGVTNQTVADNLRANGYNFYGDWDTANDEFKGISPGSISGEFAWMDSFIDQVWLNNSFQLALMTLLFSVKSLPYNAAGYSLIRASMMDPINAAINFGAIAQGVPLSSQQAAEVNNAAGIQIDGILSSQGWYLQILPAAPIARAARTTPPITFWYMDGGSIQQINVASLEVQ